VVEVELSVLLLHASILQIYAKDSCHPEEEIPLEDSDPFLVNKHEIKN
jgi:hypothetical protein